MSDQRFDLVNDIVEAAVELPPDQREAFVARHCERDAALRHSVLRLLSACEKMGDFLCAPPLRAPEVKPGDLLAGRFRVLEKLGEGGMGSVYLAEDRELGEVALKTVRAELRGDDEAIGRFRSEIRLSRGVGHRNVCPVFELFPNEQTVAGPVTFFTMKYLKGETLARRLARGPMELAEAVALARGIAAGLDALHGEGIIHRDLKPGNIILTPEPDGTVRPVITDFGLARTAAGAGADASKTGAAQILGSPDYMAPEQFLSAAVTKAADIYAFGLIVYEMVSGARPFPKEDMLRAAVRRVTEDAPALAERSLANGVARALARDVAARAGSAGEVLGRAARPGLAISRRAVLGVGAGAAAAAVTGAFVWREKHPRLPGHPTVLIADPRGNDPMLDAAVLQMRKVVAQSDAVTLWDDRRFGEIWHRMRGDRKPDPTARDWREVAMRDGVPVVLFTSLNRVGDAFSLDVRVELVEGNPEKPWQHWQRGFEIANEALLVQTLGEAGRWVRQTIGESATEIAGNSSAPEAVTTPSWAALMEFTRAERLAAQSGKQGEALFAYASAVRIDPDFTMAWMRQGDIQIRLGQDTEGYKSWQNALGASQRRPLTRREDLHFRSMLASDSGDFRAAEKLFKEYASYFPQEDYGRFYRAYPLITIGRVEEAKNLLESCLEAPQRRKIALSHLVVCDLYLGNREGAEKWRLQLRTMGADGLAARAAALIHYCHAETDAALTACDEAERDTTALSPSRAGYYRCAILADSGRTADAVRLALSAGAQNKKSGNMDSRAQNLISAGYLLLREDPAEARNVVRDLDLATVAPQQFGRLAHILCHAGEPDEAARLLRYLPEGLNFPRFRIPRLVIAGELKLARGSASGAVASMQDAAALDYPVYGKEYLAEAFLRAGDRDRAKTEYQSVLKGQCFQLGYFLQEPAGVIWRANKALGQL